MLPGMRAGSSQAKLPRLEVGEVKGSDRRYWLTLREVEIKALFNQECACGRGYVGGFYNSKARQPHQKSRARLFSRERKKDPIRVTG